MGTIDQRKAIITDEQFWRRKDLKDFRARIKCLTYSFQPFGKKIPCSAAIFSLFKLAKGFDMIVG